MIANEGPPSEKTVPLNADRQVAEQAYHQKIVARQCLNLLVDIKTALSRQNRMLEILIDEQNAARIRNTDR